LLVYKIFNKLAIEFSKPKNFNKLARRREYFYFLQDDCLFLLEFVKLSRRRGKLQNDYKKIAAFYSRLV
jgi:hypothetical protein